MKKILVAVLMMMSGMTYGQTQRNLDECGNIIGGDSFFNVGDTIISQILTTSGICNQEPVFGEFPGQQTHVIVGNCNPYFLFTQNNVSNCDSWYFIGNIINPNLHRREYVVNTATLIDEVKLPNIEVYPNPSNGEVNLVSDVRAPIEIFNTSGQKIFQDWVNIGRHSLSLDLPNGVYMIRSNQFISRLVISN